MNCVFNQPGKAWAESVVRRTKILVLVPVLVAFSTVLGGQARAQILTTLYSFTATSSPYYTNSDGAPAFTGLILSGNTLYGTAWHGGIGGNGTVFKINTDGSGFTVLHTFIGGDGAQPGSLVLSGNVLYGTTYFGGGGDFGTIFKVNNDGTGFATLHTFSYGADGYQPSSLVLSSNALLGNTIGGPYNGSLKNGGSVFSLNTDGTSFSSFPTAVIAYSVILLSNSLYCVNDYTSTTSGGSIFKVNPDGTGYTDLYDFTAIANAGNNSGGASPSGLISLGNMLYGTALSGGSGGSGTLFRLNADGTGFTTLYSFSPRPYGANTDGAAPFCVVSSNHALYGIASYGGTSDNGAVFAINTDGTGFKTVYNFTATSISFPGTNSDGAIPYAGVVLSGGTLYGTTSAGGAFGNGTIFSISLPPELMITPSGASVILSWPTNSSGYTLQSTTDLSSPVWTTNLAAPVIVNDQNVVTNPVAGTQQFFRLSQ